MENDSEKAPALQAEEGKIDDRRGRYTPIIVLCVLCLVVFFYHLGTRPLWDVDEGLHASTSKDMVLTGDWVTPKVNGKNFYDKTPLFNWFVAVSYMALGFTAFAARLPAALLGLGLVLMTYLFGKRLFGSRVGFLGGVVLATSPEVIVLSRSVIHDISLAFFISVALYSFYAAYSEEKNRRLNLFLFYVAAGIAVLAKGPIGLLLPAMICGLFLLVKGRLDFLKHMGLGWGIPLFLLVAAPWYVLISMRNPDYVSYFFLKQNLGNFLSKVQAHHPAPFYFYVPVLLGGMLPWSFFLPTALYRSFANGLWRRNDGILFALSWLLVIFFFFSAAHSKLGTYILPALPAAALLVGGVWHELMTTPTPGLRRGMVSSLIVLPAMLLIWMLFVMLKNPAAAKLQPLYGVTLRDLNGLWLFLTVVPAVALLFAVFRRYRAAFVALAATFVVGILIIITVYVPKIDPYRSTKTLALTMDRMLPPGERLVFFWTLKDSALFYTNRRATVLYTEKELRNFLAEDRRVLCVIERDKYRELLHTVASSHVLAEEGNKLLISNKPMQEGSTGDNVSVK